MDSRPYRSHRVPACSVCRRRKIRCVVEQNGQGCRFCRRRNLACDGIYGGNASQLSQSHRPHGEHAVISDTDREREITSHGGERTVLAPISSASESSPMLMNPPLAEDVDILERYLTSHTDQNAEANTPYIQVSNTGGESIVYHKVPRHRKGLNIAVNAGKVQREILEHVLGSMRDGLISLCDSRCHYKTSNSDSSPAISIISILAFQFWMMLVSSSYGSKVQIVYQPR